MSIPMLFEATFDGVTDFSLANPTEVLAGSQVRRYAPAGGGPVGVLDFQTLQDFAFAPLFVWSMSLVPSGGIGTVDLRLQNGALINIIDTSISTDPIWNLLMPQGSDLVVNVDDGGPAAGALYFTFLGIASDDWFKLQCCHLLAPDLFTVSPS